MLDRLYREFALPLIHVVVPPLRLEEAQFVFHDVPAIALVTGAADFEPETTPYDDHLRWEISLRMIFFAESGWSASLRKS